MLSSLTPDLELTPRIHAAIEATKRLEPERWERLCAECDPRLPDAKGGLLSINPNYKGTIEAAIRECGWSKWKPDLPPNLTAFRTLDLSGSLGVVALKSLNPYLAVRLVASPHPERLGWDYATAGVFWKPKDPSPYVTIVLNTRSSDQVEEVLFLHPGPPNYPSIVLSPTQEIEEITVFEALNRGLRWAKCLA